MNTSTADLIEPISSTEINVDDMRRREVIDRRHAQVIDLLKKHKLDAILIRRPENFAWSTCGAKNTFPTDNEPTASIFVSESARVLLCGNVDSPEMFDYQIASQGFQHKERPWFESKDKLIADFCKGRKIGSDSPFENTKDLRHEFDQLRIGLSEFERTRFIEAGRLLVHAIEATCRHLKKGATDTEAVAELSHRLWRHQLRPVLMQVMADGRGKRYRHWREDQDQIEKYAVISVIVERDGLHVGCTRTVSFGRPPADLMVDFRRVALIYATALFYSQPGWTISKLMHPLENVFSKFGCEDEWKLADFGAVTGYRPTESVVLPENGLKLAKLTPLHWYPTVGQARIGDTILVKDSGFEWATPVDTWPTMEVEIKGNRFSLPDVLQRD